MPSNSSLQKNPSQHAIAKINRWKQNFLDLSNRNQQLNFSPKKYIELIHPEASTIFKILCVLGQPCTFPPVFRSKSRRAKKAKKSTESADTPPAQLEQKMDDEEKDSHKAAIQKAVEKARLTEVISELSDDSLLSQLKKLQQAVKEAEEERGINILFLTMGLLHWVDKNDHEKYQSPLLFIPVKINLNPLEIALLDDSVVANPSLREKLLMQKIKLPTFPEEFDSRAVSEYFRRVQEEIESDWVIEPRCFLGTYAFTKGSLYEDLNKYNDLLLTHPIINAIAEESGYVEPKTNLPDEKDLTDALDPLQNLTILDADSSQMEAVIYAKAGSSLVIQGPPGTGKSQTITNIIAECIGVGKKVLFVAQKRAAIDVVKKRLEKCGLGDFCLQVYSQNTNKQDILSQIEQSMNLDFQQMQVREEKYRELNLLRQRLNEYVELINRPFGIMDLSVYQIMGKLLTLEKIPLIEAEIKDPNEVSESEFADAKDLFTQLEQFRETLEHYDDNPWYTAKIQSPLILSNELKLVLKKTLSDFQAVNDNLRSGLLLLLDKYPLPYFEPNSAQDQWEHSIAKVKYWIDVFQNIYPLWSAFETDYSDLSDYFNLEGVLPYDDLEIYFQPLIQATLAYKLKAKFSLSEAIQQILTALRLYLGKLEEFHNRITVFNLKSRLKPIMADRELTRYLDFFDYYRSNSLLLDVESLIARFTVDYAGALKQRGESYNKDKETILGTVRNADPKSNLLGHLNIIKKFHDEMGKPFGATSEALHDLVSEFYENVALWREMRELENHFYPLLGIKPLDDGINYALFDENIKFCKNWLKNLPFLNNWFEIQVRAYRLHDLGFDTLLNAFKNKEIVFSEAPNGKVPLVGLFEKTFYTKWVLDLIESLPPLANFNSSQHLTTIKRFVELDEEIQLLNQERLKGILGNIRPKSDLESSADTLLTESGFIKREMQKKRNVKPVRTIFSEAKTLISILKPCIMMSPLAIANYLAADDYNQFFDVVIFDEASQVTPEDAIGAILRGKSLIVVGDSEQLPPTNFFTASKASLEDDMDFVDPDLDSPMQTMESLLEECSGIGFREKLLKFHYRSRKEGLIAFSNQEYYNGRLYTFPDVSANFSASNLTRPIPADSNNSSIESSANFEDYRDIGKLPAIEFRHIKTGVKEKGKNPLEAEAIAEAICNHYLGNQQSDTSYSLGVVAFSEAQQEVIRSALEKKIRSRPELENLIDFNAEEGLFIKNLENVQGDERDFIFFSVGYARDSSGNMSLNFGPLNRAGGYRRLNVAITRARVHIKIFASFLPDDIDLAKVNARGLRDLISYMDFARKGRFSGGMQKSSILESLITNESIEKDIKSTLESKGFVVMQNVGASKFKIDLAVLDPNDTSKFALGIITDGGSYCNATIARDRERIRNQILEGLGWRILHVWSKDWYQNKNIILNMILSILKINP